MRTSLCPPFPSNLWRNDGESTILRCAPCCGNIKRWLEDRDGVLPPRAALKSVPRAPKDSKLQGVQTEPRHIISWLFLNPESLPFPFALWDKTDRHSPHIRPRKTPVTMRVPVACCGFCAYQKVGLLIAKPPPPPEARKKMMGRGTGVVVMVVVQCKQLSLSQTPRSFQDDRGSSQPRYSSCGDDWRENAPDPVQRLANE